MTVSPRRVGILVSGRGSNMVALCEAVRAGEIGAEIAIVISDTPRAPALDKARSFGVETAVVAPGSRAGRRREDVRREHEALLARRLDQAGVEIVCLAGYMRILSPEFVERYAGRMLNIHPSLLPAFPGLRAQRQALAAGVRITGCTVHFVDAGVDRGPIVAQAAVPVRPDDDEASLAERILIQEHRIYPRALALLCAGRVRLDDGRVVIDPEADWRDLALWSGAGRSSAAPAQRHD